MLRDELQNMQNKQASPSEQDDLSQLDPEAMNSMLMQFAQMHQMMAGNTSSGWNMSRSDNQQPYNINIAPALHQTPPLPPPPPYFQYNMGHPNEMMPVPMGMGFNMNQPIHPMHQQQGLNRNSGNSRNSNEVDDDWSTRPRAANHINKSALMYIPELGLSQKSVKASGNLEQNILKSVEGLLEDDDPDKFDSDFQQNTNSNSQFLTVKKPRSMENSLFGTAKQSSGWSDTTASKLNKTRRSGNESGPSLVTKSFGESKESKPKQNISELSTIFEAKDGLFFSWNNSNKTEESKGGRDSDLCEGFKLIGQAEPITPLPGPPTNKQPEEGKIFKSDFFSKSVQPKSQDNGDHDDPSK